MKDNRSVITPESLRLGEIVRVEVYRGHRGHYAAEPDETPCVEDTIVTTGRNWLALRIGPVQNSPMGWMAVGTGTAAPALTDGSTPGLYGEVKRKALSTNTAGITAANIYTAVMTLGGSADSVTSLVIQEAGVANHPNSGQGTLFQRVIFSQVVLANSDLVKFTLETNVGSS